MQIGDRSFAGYPSYKWSRLPDAVVLPISEKDESPSTPVSTPIPSDLGTSSSLANLLWRSQSETTDTSSVETSFGDSSSSQDVLDEFKKWAEMTPAQKIRASFLESHHLTEEQLAQMPADQRQQIEDEIKREIKQKLGIDKTGDADGSDAAKS